MKRCLVTFLLLSSAACAGTGRLAGPGRVGSAAPEAPAPPEGWAEVLRAEDRREPDVAVGHVLAAEPALRARAVRAVGRIGGAVLPVLTEALEDRDAAVRVEAAFGLGLLQDAGALPALVARRRDPEAAVRAAVARSLGLLGGEGVVEPLAEMLEDPEPAVRAAAFDAFARSAEAARVVERAMVLAGDSDAEVRRAAVRAVAEAAAAIPGRGRGRSVDLRTRGHARAYMETLRDHADPVLRMHAAAGLLAPATLGERLAIAELAADPDRAVRIAAVRSLAVPGTSLATLGPILARDPDLHVRWTVLESLERVGRPAAELLVQHVVAAPEPWLQERALLSLGGIDPARAARLASGLPDAPAAVRVAALRAATGVDAELRGALVERAVRDPDPRVRAAAVSVQVEAGEPLGPVLAAAGRDRDPLVRLAVARAAGARLAAGPPDDALVEDALAMLRAVGETSGGAGPEILVRREVLEQASRLGPDPRARGILEAGLADPAREVRALAAARLAALFEVRAHDRVGPAAELPLEHYVEVLRWAGRPRAAVITVERPGFRPGRFTVRLDTESAPLTCRRFARLAERGFYDGLAVHRVLPNLRLEAGDPRGDGLGGPGDWARDEPGRGSLDAGALVMRSHGRDVTGSQWYVALADQPSPAERETIFGRVVQNFEGVAALIVPGDRIVSIRIYEGDGSEPLPPLAE